jgi:lipopolysaccharide export LptBFGC system permease protein LptF
MKPEIEAYLREHGQTYTGDALRQQLIAAGHDPTEVDEALRETELARAAQTSQTQGLRRRFWLWAIGLHVAALAVATVWILLGSTRDFYVGLAIIVLGIVLLIGLGISGLIGRALLHQGMGVAVVVPLISALLLGGSCMAMAGPVTL